jgi:putative oxidoreductase
MKNRILSPASMNTDLATLLLRLIFGGMFTYYGYLKAEAYDQYSTIFPDYLGIGPTTTYILVIFAELVCGFFIAIGFVTRLAIIPIFITMLFVVFKAHAADPFEAKNLPIVYLLLCPIIFILGSGRFSLDRALFKRTY